MRSVDTFGWVSKQRRQWRQWAGWLVLVCYLGILFLMASFFWHVMNVFLFISVFVGLHVLVAIGFKFLQTGRK